MKKLAVSAFVAITAFATASEAAIVNYAFTVRADNFEPFRDVTNVEPFFADVIPGETEFSGSFSYDTEAAPFTAGSTTNFNGAGALAFTLPAFDFDALSSARMNDGTFNGRDRLEFSAVNGDLSNGFSSLARLSFLDTTATALDTQNELPPSISLSDFSSAAFVLQISERESFSTIGALTLRGTITSLTDPNAVETVPLPAPGVLLLFALGAGGLMARRRAVAV